MEINGLIFKAAREKIRAHFPGRGEPGYPAKGTQEWLSYEAKVSLRAVQYLEKGNASLRTIKAVSKLLNISNWEEYIYNYGIEYVTCSAKNMVDFRPELYPPHNAETFSNSTMQMTIDPLSLVVEEGKFKDIHLKEVVASLSGLETNIEFVWLAEVLLTPAGNGWLGWVKEMQVLCLPADNSAVNIPIMFRQNNVPQLSWGDFVTQIESLNTSQLEIDIYLKFETFEKHIRIFLSVDLLKRLFTEGRLKHQSNWPYRVQLQTIT